MFEAGADSIRGGAWRIDGTAAAADEPRLLREALISVDRELQECRRTLDSLLDTSFGIFYRSGLQPPWPLQFVSRHVAELTGYSADELKQQSHWGGIIHREDRPRVEAAVERAAAAGTSFTLSYRIIHKSGGVRWVRERGHVVRQADGRPACLEGFIEDVTDQALLEQSLRAAEQAERTHSERLRATLENIPHMLWGVSLDTGEEFYSRRWLEFAGIEPGAPVPRIDLVHPDDREAAWAAWQHSLATGEPYQAEYRLRHHSGRYRWMLSRGNPERDPQGAIVAWYGTCTDVHDRAVARLQLEQSQRRFARTLDSMPQMVWSMAAGQASPDYYNQRWYEFTGLPTGSLDGPEWEGFVHPEDAERALASWRRCRAAGDPYEAEYRLRHHSGAYRWVVSQGRLERAADGSPERWYGTCTDIHESYLAREALNRSEQRIQGILNSVPQVIWSADARGRLDFISNQWTRIFDPGAPSPIAGNWLTSVHPDDRERVSATWRETSRSGEPYELEFRVRGQAGAWRWVLARALPERDQSGATVRWYGTCVDIHQRVEAERSLEESERLTRGILAANPDCVGLFDMDGTMLFANDAMAQEYRVERPAALVGRRWTDVLPEYLQEKAEVALARARRGETTRMVLQFGRSSRRWWDIVATPVRSEVEGGRILVVSRDITEQKLAEERANWAANHDPLTGLPNRLLMQRQLDGAVEEAKARAGAGFALLMVDIDNFKHVNDTVGHDAGDALLCEFARRLEDSAGEGDTVSRLGGDEFAILIPGIGAEPELKRVIDGIFDSLRAPCVHAGRVLDLQASIGACLYPAHGDSGKKLLKNADVALYAAKAAGRNTFKLFAPAMRAELQRRASMLNIAKRALRDRWIRPFYQPKIDLRTGELAGFEALLRWGPEGGRLNAPAGIAAAFEDASLAGRISDRIVGCVLDDISRWRDAGVDFKSVAINAAAAEFRREDFAERVLERLAKASVEPGAVQLEVTETVFLGRGAECVGRALRLLSDAGVKIALDDFGTGYASLSHLKQFPVDLIKIDRSFIENLQVDAEDGAIVDALINLARTLKIGVVAEGIETTAQHDFLAALGCDFGQGFLYGEPGPASAVPAICRGLSASGLLAAG